MEEKTIIELLPNSKRIEKGTKTIDSGDSWVEVLDIISIEMKNGHAFMECTVNFLEE